MPEQTCKKCKQTKPLTEFYKGAAYKSKHKTECKTCAAERSHEYYLKNSAVILAFVKNYYENNREAILANSRKRYYANHEQTKAYFRAYAKGYRARQKATSHDQ
jgi:hypothetical protein